MEQDQINQQLVDDDIRAIEQALVTQWSVYGKAPGGNWHEEPDLAWAEAPIPQLPYNAVVRSHLGADAADRVKGICTHFHDREVQFMWLVHPTTTPGNMVDLLLQHGLSHAEDVTGMSLDLSSWQPTLDEPGDQVVFTEVVDKASRESYEDLLVTYWELPEESQFYAVGMSEWSLSTGVPGARWVSFLDGEPVGKVYLSLGSSDETAAIYGVFVKPEARGHGIAGWLSHLAVMRAKELGCRRVVLHSSAMALNIYRRLGFIDRCTISVYGTTSLHSPQLI